MHIKNVSLVCPFGNCHCDTSEICEHANKSIVSSFSGKYIIYAQAYQVPKIYMEISMIDSVKPLKRLIYVIISE